MILREKHSADSGYCIISRRLAQETTLPADAKALLIYMLSFPDNWEHTISTLSKGRNDTPENICKQLAELNYYGYYRENIETNINGTKILIGLLISEYPMKKE